MTLFIEYLNAIVPLSDEAKNAIYPCLKKQHYKKNETIVRELASSQYLHFVEKGLIRAFYLKEEKEITDWFGLEKSIVGPIVRNFPIKKTIHRLETIEDTTLISISFNNLEKLYFQYHELERLGRIIAIQSMLLLQQKIDSIQFYSAKERYIDFITSYPTIIQRAPLGMIASYLGMNQVTLSRVRKMNV
ncbi:MAG: Crp/Fnr family transcriptional regulator [Flavobacteriia bacterium]|nr:Crp/Fnr family transcriptional regulator [Flavobacteriia bacterium]